MHEFIKKKIEDIAWQNVQFSKPEWEGIVIGGFPICNWYKRYLHGEIKLSDEDLIQTYADIVRFHTTINMLDTSLVKEIKAYIQNSENIALAVLPLQESAAERGDYYKAHEYKISGSMHSSTAFHLTRIINGLPAFEESHKLVNKTNNNGQ
jgi:hypothetical protein